MGLLLCGCSMLQAPVPTTKFSAKFAGQTFEWENPKNTSMTNILMEVSTNGTARLSIGAVTSANDAGVISNSYLGQAMVLHEAGVQMNQAFQNGAAAAGAVIGAAAKAP
jgi:hypothetical protein